MNVKLQIKEVEEEWRPITLEEKCMFLLSTDMNYSPEIRDEIRKRLDVLGLIRRGGSENVVFRVETIRDATPTEVIAWHTLQSFDKCIWTHIACDACAKKIGPTDCHITEECDRAEEILKGKEVIVEVVK